MENVNFLWNVEKLTEISHFLAWYERMQDIYIKNRNRRLISSFGLLALEVLRTLTSSRINTWQGSGINPELVSFFYFISAQC